VGGNFWDGRATGEKLGNPAADQAQGPFLNPREQALGSPADVVERVCAGDYSDLFLSVWGAEICDEANVDEAYDYMALSIAAYENSLDVNAFSSKYDAYLAGMADLTREERRGLSLFKGKGKCAKCHVLGSGHGRTPALFTDFTYDNLGVPANPQNPVYDYDPDFVDHGLGGFLATIPAYEGLAPSFDGMQKVPTLRNVDRRPDAASAKAFGHNGYFKSLWQIVHFYNTRDVLDQCAGDVTAEQAIAENCWPAPEVEANVNTSELGNLRLSEADELAIVAFLQTLSDGWQ
jgi:cytochrome c peroxidase